MDNVKSDSRYRNLESCQELIIALLSGSSSSVSVLKSVRDKQNNIIDFEWVTANEVAKKEMNVSSVSGTRFRTIHSGKHMQGLFESYKEVVNTGKRVVFEVQYRDSKLKWYRNTAVKYYDGFVVSSQDITEQKNKEQQSAYTLRFVTKIAETSPFIIYVLNLTDNSVLYANRTLAQELGYTPEQAEAMDNAMLGAIHNDDKPAILQHLKDMRHAKDGLLLTVYYRVVAADGTHKWFMDMHTVFARNRSGRPIQMLGFSIDVTKQKADETKLGKHAEELERMSLELSELNRSLKRKNNELIAKNDEFNTITFVASHDMKEPLRKILTFSSMIKDRDEDNISDEGRMLFGRMCQSVEHMQRMTDDILRYAQLDHDRSNRTTVNLNEVLQKAKEGLQGVIEKNSAVIKGKDLPQIKGNETLLIQLFQNFLDNAIKFRKKNKDPQVNIFAKVIMSSEMKHPEAMPAQQYLRITFEDNGIGFDREYKEKIFKLFQRLHPRDYYMGTGLGLAICKKIVDLHDGFIEVDATPGEGSTFCCYLPV